MAAAFVGVGVNWFLIGFHPSAVIAFAKAKGVLFIIFDDGTTFRAVENFVDVCVGLHGLFRFGAEPEHHFFHTETLESSALPVTNGEMRHPFFDLCIKGTEANAQKRSHLITAKNGLDCSYLYVFLFHAAGFVV